MVSFLMLLLVIPLAAGVAVGFALRGRRRFDFGRVSFGVILVLIFSLGFTVGSNNDLLGSLPTVGVSAFVLALLAVGFSVFFVVLLRKRWRL